MARKARSAAQKAASRKNLEKARAARKSTGLPSMGNAADAKARAFKRKPKGSSAMNAGARAAATTRIMKASNAVPGNSLADADKAAVKGWAGKKVTGLPSMGNSKDALKRAFKRKAKGTSRKLKNT